MRSTVQAVRGECRCALGTAARASGKLWPAMIPSRHPAIYKETLSTLIALPLLHAQDCHAGLLHASAAAARQSPDGAPRVEV